MEVKGAMTSLKKYWLSHGVQINDGVSEEALKSFEARYGVVLPKDLRNYFLSVNGMPPGVVDDQMIRFWMLGEIAPLPAGAPQYSDKYVQNPESLFLFADYSIWAHAYAIRLGDTSLESNEVVIIGYESPVFLSASFSEFVESYLTDTSLLF